MHSRPQRCSSLNVSPTTWRKETLCRHSRNLFTAGSEILRCHKRIYLSSWPWLPTVTMPDHRVLTGEPNDRFLSNAFKRCYRLSGVLLKFCRLILGCAKKNYLFVYSRGTWLFSNLLGLFCPFPENLRSYHLSENDSWPFFGTQNDIFNNPKTTDIEFLIPRKFEATILFRKSEGIKGLPNR